MRLCTVGGTYLRVFDPDWDDPLDSKHARRVGGRWNAPGSFRVLYLNESVSSARANAKRVMARQRALGISVDMLEPSGLPALQRVAVPTGQAVDLVSAVGLRSAHLPVTYPFDVLGQPVEHAPCQAVGLMAFEAGHVGLRVRCAAADALPRDLELAWLPDNGGDAIRDGEPVPFSEWFG